MTTSDSTRVIRRFAHRVVDVLGRLRGCSSTCMSMEEITDSIVTIAPGALTAGAISLVKARVITKALDELATEPEVGTDILADAEQHMVSIAPDFTAKQLRRLAQRVLDVVAPGLAEEREAKTLESQEQRALRRMSVTFHEAPDRLESITEIRTRMPSPVAGRQRVHLEAYTAATARRRACTANLIPAVLGTDSEILDLGRNARLFSPAQRKAMTIRDKHCRAEGCSIPADWCEAHHHRQPRSQGDKTNLADGKLHCSYHHHRAHDTQYLTNELPNGDVKFSRRTCVSTRFVVPIREPG